jgi:hypothetical protein
MTIVKIIMITAITFLVSGCAVSPYSPPINGEFAYIKPPQSTDGNYSFFGGYTKRSVYIGQLNQDGCIGLRESSPINVKSLEKDGSLKVLANVDLVINVGSIIGNTSCGVFASVKLEKDEKYLLSYLSSGRSCAISLEKESTNGDLKKVTLRNLEDKVFKFCKM